MLRFLSLALALLPWFAHESVAQYPSRPVTLVVPYDPGGGVDVTARALALKLSSGGNQRFIVENKPGVSGITGAQYVANATPDGYTLLMAADTTTSAPFLLQNLSVDLERDILPVTQVSVTPFVLVVSPKINVKTPQELVAYAKQHQADFFWATGGVGTSGHLAIERFGRLTGFNPDKIPYKGGDAAVRAVLTGEVGAMFASPASLRDMVASGQMRALAVTTPSEFPMLPGVPTLASYGFPNFQASSWYGIWAPKGTDPAIVKAVHAAVSGAASDAALNKQLANAGVSLAVSKNPEEFQAFVKSEFDTNRTVIKSLNIDPAKL